MKKTNILLTTLAIFFSLSITPVIGISATPILFDNGILSRHGTYAKLPAFGSTAEIDAVATTTLIKKNKTDARLYEWFPNYFSSADVSGKSQLTLKGYDIIPFDGTLEGKPQRGIAIDFGKFFLVERSTDLRLSAEKLLENAQVTFEKTLKSEASKLLASGCQCTDYAGDLVPSLPNGLWTINDKKAIINHLFPQGNGGQMSSVAVHDIGTTAGHVSVVTGVSVRTADGNLQVYITEKNYSAYCTISTRNGTMEALKIVGYFDPRYSVPSSFPNIISAANTSAPATVPFTVSINGSGFDPGSIQAVILGGSYCTTFTSCQIGNGSLTNKTGSSVNVPLTLNVAGKYRLYLFNTSSGKTTFGQPITIY